MTPQNDGELKTLNFISIGLLIIGFVGIVFNLIAAPAVFPVGPLFLTATGAMLAVAVSTKYLIWRQYQAR